MFRQLVIGFGLFPLAGCITADLGGPSGTDAGSGGASTSQGPATASATVTGSGGSNSGSTTVGTGGMASSTGATMAASSSSSSGSGGNNPNDPVAVCARWKADRSDMSEGQWSGSLNSCTPGDISASARDNALRVVNLYRWLAELPEVVHEAGRNQAAQACALMMTANQKLSHNPPQSWNCYSQEGKAAAGKSNIATTPGVAAVDLYMIDPGNDTTIGHRRWILSNSVGPIGLGSTDSYSCMHVLSGSGNAKASYTAFPSPGPFPMQGFNVSFTSLDKTGWTIQSDSITVNTNVTVTENGNSLPVKVFELLPNYGSKSAIRFTPDGWKAEAGKSYRVQVASTPIDYTVDVINCP